MTNRLGRWLIVAVLVAFAGVTLSIDFFHTEGRSAGPGRHECPACHFLNSSLSVSPVVAPVLPALICRRLPVTVAPSRVVEVPVLFLSSRSPPQV
jgi:hypothetical protein